MNPEKFLPSSHQAVILIASFFLPIGTHASTTVWYCKGPSYGNEIGAMLFKYAWILIPFRSDAAYWGGKHESYFLGRGIWAFLPWLRYCTCLSAPYPWWAAVWHHGYDQGFGVGTWMALVGSLVLAFCMAEAITRMINEVKGCLCKAAFLLQP